MKIFLAVIITLVALIIIGLAFIYSGVYNVAAINPPGSLETWFFSTISDNSVESHSKGIIPPPLDDSTFVDEGFRLFDRMCVGCHGAPGIDPGRNSRSFNPVPPNLTESVTDLSDAEIFWIVKNGIKMTAMPAFGKTRTDDEIWQIVSIVHRLPDMTPDQYQAFRNRLEEQR
jgi:mono/diheme cytochrome c family protein